MQKKFVSDASHELRTPLLIINGYAELLETWGMEDKEIAQEAIKNIKDEGNNMKKIIEDLLFLAREDNGTLELNLEPLDICELLAQLKRDYALIGHEIQVECSDSIIISGDKSLFLQGLRALIENSIKFSEDKIILKGEVKGDNIYISIIDFGIGIPENKIDDIFNRFVKLEDHRNRNKGGNGLGLSIVLEIIKKHNWDIKVSSEEGKGTTMTIIIKGENKGV
jgi:signal transduction histidine kinase